MIFQVLGILRVEMTPSYMYALPFPDCHPFRVALDLLSTSPDNLLTLDA